MSQRMSQRGKTKEKRMESPRPLVDPDRLEFTIGLTLNGNGSDGYFNRKTYRCIRSPLKAHNSKWLCGTSTTSSRGAGCAIIQDNSAS
ncbi:hypothetical protein FCM35_KLT11475 [Carex littledalei]|uniref:Uncharacterized protein n=1 Tax=Carex littledalei TaxID=544730 RepID=A0A833QQY5_9POAL|nr:hypothetical protein FCM35_KLT11475 [Carex littledalei]